MIAFQVLFGMGAGGDYPICSAYVSEVMPKRLRSRMVAGFAVLGATVTFLFKVKPDGGSAE